jgi:hypothetical protein
LHTLFLYGARKVWKIVDEICVFARMHVLRKYGSIWGLIIVCDLCNNDRLSSDEGEQKHRKHKKKIRREVDLYNSSKAKLKNKKHK